MEARLKSSASDYLELRNSLSGPEYGTAELFLPPV